jgi:hypothetical protein
MGTLLQAQHPEANKAIAPSATAQRPAMAPVAEQQRSDVSSKYSQLTVTRPLSQADTDKFESPKAVIVDQQQLQFSKLPTVQLGSGLRSPAFLNQGESDDSDEEVRLAHTMRLQ